MVALVQFEAVIKQFNRFETHEQLIKSKVVPFLQSEAVIEQSA
jgi:hypothetical protein